MKAFCPKSEVRNLSSLDPGRRTNSHKSGARDKNGVCKRHRIFFLSGFLTAVSVIFFLRSKRPQPNLLVGGAIHRHANFLLISRFLFIIFVTILFS